MIRREGFDTTLHRTYPQFEANEEPAFLVCPFVQRRLLALLASRSPLFFLALWEFQARGESVGFPVLLEYWVSSFLCFLQSAPKFLPFLASGILFGLPVGILLALSPHTGNKFFLLSVFL